MLASLERTIVVVVEAVIGASTRMLVVESLHDAFPLRRSALLWGILDGFGDIKNTPRIAATEIPFICDNTTHCMAEVLWDMGGVSGGNSARLLSSIVHIRNQSTNNGITRHGSRGLRRKL
jgi:hypothetical protein